jgi:hypothetical protein
VSDDRTSELDNCYAMQLEGLGEDHRKGHLWRLSLLPAIGVQFPDYERLSCYEISGAQRKERPVHGMERGLERTQVAKQSFYRVRSWMPRMSPQAG